MRNPSSGRPLASTSCVIDSWVLLSSSLRPPNAASAPLAVESPPYPDIEALIASRTPPAWATAVNVFIARGPSKPIFSSVRIESDPPLLSASNTCAKASPGLLLTSDANWVVVLPTAVAYVVSSPVPSRAERSMSPIILFITLAAR